MVARAPMVLDFIVHGACEQASVMVNSDKGASHADTLQVAFQTVKQEGSLKYQTRVRLRSSIFDEQRSTQSIRVTIECPTHGQQVVEHLIHEKTLESIITPDWAKGLVWYQVFPERFRDGNPNNSQNAWDTTPMAWDSEFGEVTSEEVERAWNRSRVDPRHYPYDNNRAGGAIATVAFARRYGGDLIGVYNQLESLSQQGYTGIYLCPVFQSRSLHKYDADDHRHIDPTLGHPGVYADPGPGNTRLGADEDPSDESTWEWTVSDRWFIDKFLPKAKSLGLRVVLDGVWNHVGTDHFAFSDITEHGDRSEFVDWFDVEFDEDGKLFAWKSWGSINGNLPVFKQTPTGDLAPGPKAHMMAVTRRWMDPNGDGDPSDGIDGWRLDVAGEIGKPFWKDWRAQVRRVNPDALIIAEIWSDAGKMFNDEGFDGQMNYPFAYAIADWLSIGDTRGDAKICASRLTSVFHHEPQHDLVQFNLMTSHDTERLASMMHNSFVRGYDNGASRWQKGTRYESEAVNDDDRARALAAIAAMVASPGSMMIYNGDEYAMTGADDPDNRRPIPWQEFEAKQRSAIADASIRFNHAVNALLRLRTELGISEVLRFGTVEFSGNEDGSLLIRRQLNNRRVEFLIDSQLGNPGSPAWRAGELGWDIESESERKMGLIGEVGAVRVRVLVRSILH